MGLVGSVGLDFEMRELCLYGYLVTGLWTPKLGLGNGISEWTHKLSFLQICQRPLHFSVLSKQRRGADMWLKRGRGIHK